LKFSLLDFHRVVFWGGYLILVITPRRPAPPLPLNKKLRVFREEGIKNQRTAGSVLLE
jgi:hypothetical protein